MKNGLRKYLAILMALVLALGAISAFAEEIDEPEEQIEYPDELLVGNPTRMKGDFFTEMFGNDTADIDVRALIHGYNLVSWDQNQGVYLIDESVVEDCVVMTNEVGDKFYYLALYDDLYYSDGTPITAWDYAFSLLLMMSPEMEEIGGKIYRAEHILGYDEYITGERSYLEGVGVIDDHQLVIMLDHDFLPYFFETGLLLCVPYPISVIAPGCKVYSDGAQDQGDGYGYGIYIDNEDRNDPEKKFTAELLKTTILDPDTGYNSHPSVSSGPYVLTDFDYETAHFEINPYFKGAWLYNTLPDDFYYDIENYTGTGTYVGLISGPNIIQVDRLDEEGNENPMYLVKPTIEKITYTVADNDTIPQDLADGTLHLVNKVVYGPTINAVLGIDEEEDEFGDAEDEEITDDLDEDFDEDFDEEFEDEEEDAIRFQNYPRIGLAFLTFTFEKATVHEMAVRQAIAWCMDRQALTDEYTSGYGLVVNGYYGMEQWEYLLCTGALEYPVNFIGDEIYTDEELEEMRLHQNMYAETDEDYDKMIAAWEMLSLDNLVNYNVYDLEDDPERTDKVGIRKANALLDDAGWTLNLDGNAYTPGVDAVRCKNIDGELVALDLSMLYPEGNHIVDTMQENFIDNLNECGILLTLVPAPMEELLSAYYRETERTTDMIYLATNFHVVIDPSITYSTDRTANHLIWNNTYSDDEDLYWRAVNMRKTDPLDVYDYVAKWISFQERYNEVLPAIPLYSNVYFDFWMNQLQNYDVNGHVTWSQAILSAYFGPTEDVVFEEEEVDEDVEWFED